MVKSTTDNKRQLVNEIHKPARINFKRRRVILKSLNDLFQADLVEMIPYAKFNKDYKYILIVINCFSKYVWALPLKSKTGTEVSASMEQIFKQQTPKNLQTDMGKEFFNKQFEVLTKKYNVNHYNTFSEKKASIVERVNRTLKGWMWKEFNMQGNYKWLTLLPQIVHQYNNKIHRTINMKPVDVTKKKEKMLLDTVYNKIKISELNSKLKLGDYVRVSKVRGVFDKKYNPNWSTEVFVIRKVQLTNPTTYLLEDLQHENIEGAFYKEQLQKTKFHDVYLVEKILKRNKNKIFVKWLGFSDKFNSWIDKSNFV